MTEPTHNFPPATDATAPASSASEKKDLLSLLPQELEHFHDAETAGVVLEDGDDLSSLGEAAVVPQHGLRIHGQFCQDGSLPGRADRAAAACM